MKTEQHMLTETMQLAPWEKKAVEKLRESLEKARPGQMQVGRQFSWPSPEDGEENMHVSVSCYISQWTPKMSETDAKVGLFRELEDRPPIK